MREFQCGKICVAFAPKRRERGFRDQTEEAGIFVPNRREQGPSGP
jgi:hypothetical protein